jgi:hypothetical protein
VNRSIRVFDKFGTEVESRRQVGRKVQLRSETKMDGRRRNLSHVWSERLVADLSTR